MSTAVAKTESVIPRELATGVGEGGAEPEKGRLSIPYIGFFGEKARAETARALTEAGVKVNSFYLHHIAPIAIDPFQAHPLTLTRLYTIQDDDMQVESCKLQSDKEAFEEGYREHLFGVAAVRLHSTEGTKFQAALFNVRSGLCQAFTKAIEMFKVARNEAEWSARGPTYKASAGAVLPGGRFFASIRGKVDTTAGGRDFNLGIGLVQPTPAADIPLFNKWYAENATLVEALCRVNAERVSEAKKTLVD